MVITPNIYLAEKNVLGKYTPKMVITPAYIDILWSSFMNTFVIIYIFQIVGIYKLSYPSKILKDRNRHETTWME